MPATQRNWNYYDYVSGDGQTYSIRASEEWAAVAAHGLTLTTTARPRYIASAQQRPRKALYRDNTTFRTTSGPVGTSADWDALTLTTDTITVAVPGLATGVTYNLLKKIPEKIPVISVGRQDPDHA